MAVDREALVRSAEKYVQRGKIDAAIKEYRKVLAEFPTDANTLNRVGDLYARLEKFDEAVKFFTQIAEQYTRDGFFVKAIAIYKKIIKLDPTSLAVYERLAELYWRQGLINEARTQYQVLADYYTRHSNATSAITIYQKMAEVEPENPSYRLKLAELYQSQRLFEKSLREYRALADLLLVAGQIDETVQVYSKAFELTGEGLDYVREAVAGLKEAGHTAAATRLLARATELNPKAAALAQQIGLRTAEPEPPPPEPSYTPPEPVYDAGGSGAYQAPAFDEAPAFDAAFGAQAYPATGSPSFDSPLEAAPSFDAVGFGAGNNYEAASFDSPSFESPAAYSGYGATSFGGFDEEKPPAPLPSPGRPEAGYSQQEAVSLDDEFSFDLESDDEPESLVRPPADVLTDVRTTARDGYGKNDAFADNRAGEDAEVDVGEFAFEIDLDGDGGMAADASPYSSPAYPTQFGDNKAKAPTIAPVEIEWSMDPMADLDLALPPPDDEPVMATDLRGNLRQDETFEIEVDLDATAPVLSSPAYGAPAAPVPAAAPSAPSITAQPFSLNLDDDDEEDEGVYSIDLEATAAGFGEVELEVELEDTAAVAPAAAAPTPAAAPPRVATAVRPALAPLTPEPTLEEDEDEDDLAAVRREEDLLAEARVFAKYGLKEKALDRVRDLLQASPAHLEGLTLLTRFDLEAGRHADARGNANEIARLTREGADPARWSELKTELQAAGFGVENDRVSFLPGEARPLPAKAPAKSGDDRIAQLLEDLSLESFDSAPSREREERHSYQSLLQDTPPEPPKAPAAPPPPPEPAKTSLASLVDELGLDDDDEELAAPVRRPVPHAPAAPRTPDPLDETGMSWLDDVAPAPEKKETKAPASTETIFDEEDDFFDLAAELEAELDMVDINNSMITSLQPQEQSLEEIIEGFKQGVAEHLSAEDYDTHFNLGIAYREMGLLDEAIGEFQLSSKDSRYLVESSSMLGICFMEKGLPELAVRWYRKGLESPKISEEVTLGLLYDMGIAYMSLGDYDAAYKTFVEIYGMNSNFRDVSIKLQELAPLRQP